MKTRVILIFMVLIGLWSLLFMRATYLQVLPNEKLQSLERRLFQTVVKLNSKRGTIQDHNGRELALAQSAFSLFADPSLIEHRRETARVLAKELGMGFDFVYSKIKDPQRRFVWVSRYLPKTKKEKIEAMGIRGLVFVEEWKRVYPNDNLASQLVGFVGADGQGLEGVELYKNFDLKGENKSFLVRRDARGRPLMSNGTLFLDYPEGADIRLTVDSEIQYFLEKELGKAMSEHQAERAVGVVLDAQTSAILAMASAPFFDLNQASRVSGELRKNRAVTDAFEPGSTMKAFVIASALREKVAAPNSKYFCEGGQFKVGDRVIREAESKEKFGWMTVGEILALSSNIGTTKIAFELGAEKLRRGLMDFGFGTRSGVDYPGESKGILQPLPWKPHLLSNVSFGHGIAVTPLQIANAYAAIANGGILHKPYLIEGIRNSETGKEEMTQPQEVRRVLSKEDAAKMRMMLAEVVSPSGTGMNAKVNGYIVGGKTGTAQKVNHVTGGYLDKSYISSFAGFIPAQDPKFVIYIAVDNPKKGYYGAQVAAPVFSRVASYAVRKVGIAPQLLSDKNLFPFEKTAIKKNGPRPKDVVAELVDPLPVVSEVKAKTHLADFIGQNRNRFETVPNLVNLSLREVFREMNGKDIQLKIKGRGRVAEMDPPAGAPFPENRKITVYLK